MVTGAESGKPQATRSSAMPLKNMHQLCFVAAVVCVAVLVYIASVVLGPSVPADETDSLDHGGPPALQLSISGESLASQVRLSYGTPYGLSLIHISEPTRPY